MERSSSSLLDHDIDLISVLHLKLVGGVIILEAFSVEDEAALVDGQTLAVHVRIHQLLQLSGALDLKEDLSAVLSLNFDVNVVVPSFSWFLLSSLVG